MEEKNVEKDTLESIFESISSEILTDSIKLQMSTLFEAAINEAVEKKEQELAEANREEITEFKGELVEQVDEYLNYFVEEYIKENEAVVEDYHKVKLAEKVLRNFSQMCEAFNVSLSEESISSEDELAEAAEEKTKLVNQLIEARKEVANVKRAAFIAEAADKFETDIQRETFFEAAKKLEFEEELFEQKLNVLAQSILVKENTEEVVGEKLNEQEETETKKAVISEKMAGYLKYIKK